MKNSIKIILSILVVATLFQSCLEVPVNDAPDGMVAPEIPPMEMHTLPTENLRTTNTDTTAAQSAGQTYHNWWHAGVNLAVWSVVSYVAIAPPTAAFQRAFYEQSQYVGNSTFKWEYRYTDPNNGKKFDVELTGQYISNLQEVYWEMTASQVGGFSNFVWYTGTTAVGFASGSFTINKNPQNPSPELKLEYTKPNSYESTLRITNVAPNNPNNGDYIEYRTNLNDYYDKAFDLKHGANNLLEINWSEALRDGQVRHPQRFNDNDWHCWNTNQLDVAC